MKHVIGTTKNKSNASKNLQFAIVTSVDKVIVNTTDEKQNAKDVRFNADEHAIRCRIIGSDYDNALLDSELPNCFPLLPKHLNLKPKVNEIVLVMTFSDEDRFNDRFYVGPINSTPSKLNLETGDSTALSNFSEGKTTPPAEISKITSAKGVYIDPKHVVIHGRNNTDIAQRNGEVIIRAGKFVENNPLVFNNSNPAYIQLKFNQSINDGDSERKVSVNNIVADKINLLTHSGGRPRFNLSNVDRISGEADYISDSELKNIMETAHPLVFGDTLIEYLQLLKNALINHVHNGNGNKPTDRTDSSGNLPLEYFLNKAEKLEKNMLSRNIKIN